MPTTEAGRRLAQSAWALGPGEPCFFDSIAAIEAEAIAHARVGYVPASLEPEWHAEMETARAEGIAAERERIAEAVEKLRNPYRNHGGVGQGNAYGSGWEEARAAVLAILDREDTE